MREGRKTLFSPQERRDRTETSLACRAERYCFLPASLTSGSRTSVSGSAAGKEGPLLPPRPGEGLFPAPSGLTPGSDPAHGLFPLPLLLRPQSLSRQRLRGAGRGAETGPGPGPGHARSGDPGGGRAPPEARGPSRVRGRPAPLPLLIARRRARRARGTRGQQRRPLKRATALPASRRARRFPAPASGFIRAHSGCRPLRRRGPPRCPPAGAARVGSAGLPHGSSLLSCFNTERIPGTPLRPSLVNKDILETALKSARISHTPSFPAARRVKKNVSEDQEAKGSVVWSFYTSTSAKPCLESGLTDRTPLAARTLHPQWKFPLARVLILPGGKWLKRSVCPSLV